MRILGEVCLELAFVAAGYSAFVCFLSRAQPGSHLRQHGIRAALLSAAALLITLVILCRALLIKDFQYEYVAHYTSQLLPWHYSLSALWVGQAGSLLLWSCLTVLIAIGFYLVSANDALRQTAFGVLMTNVCFLLAIMVFAADPMRASLSERHEGLGLSPLLQHPSMLIHPPVVFLAYAAWSVPFALAIAALLDGQVNARWTQLARRWAVGAWLVLGVGLLLGANWAYQELGWGGYWGWDPVENGSFLPWLTGTALIHALMTWRQRGVLKKLAVSLAIITFALCNFATFLTRSGIFSSVHAFSESPIGWMFLAYMVIVLAGGGWLVWACRRELSPDQPLVSLVARESLALLSILVLLLMTVVVFLGTLFVPLSGMFTGRMVMIGPAFYNNVFLPVGLTLLSLTAVVPLLSWGSAPDPASRRVLAGSAGLATLVVLSAFPFYQQHGVCWVVTWLALLALATTVGRWLLDGRRAGLAAFPARWWKNRRQHGGWIIHLGLASLAIGIAGSSLETQRHEVTLAEGDKFEWADRKIEYLRLEQQELPDKLVAEIELRVTDATGRIVTLKPARHFYLLQNEWTTEVAIDSTWSGDLYTILHAGLGEGRVLVTLVENPRMRWIWFGGWVAAGGVLVAVWPAARRRGARSNRTRGAEPFAGGRRKAVLVPPVTGRAAAVGILDPWPRPQAK
jgi:cytochrome c-type biogenesis protein CcmF